MDYRQNGITSSSILCSMKDLYRVNKLILGASFHDPLKTLKLKTLASDCVINNALAHLL